jgi:hypothetical protein
LRRTEGTGVEAIPAADAQILEMEDDAVIDAAGQILMRMTFLQHLSKNGSAPLYLYGTLSQSPNGGVHNEQLYKDVGRNGEGFCGSVSRSQRLSPTP